MCLFIETIRLEDGMWISLSLHGERLNRTRRQKLGCVVDLDLERVLMPYAKRYPKGVFKGRVLYGEVIEAIEIQPYTIRPVYRLQVVDVPSVEYAYKYADRSVLKALFDRRGDCDDVLIVQQGRLGDTSICNLFLFDGTEWVTPSTPLLKGTERRRLLEQGIIREREVGIDTLDSYPLFKLCNAMIPFEKAAEICTRQGIVR